MTYFRRLSSLLLLLISFNTYAHIPTAINGAPTPSLAPMLSKAMPTVVNITVEKTPPPQTNPFQFERPKLNPNTIAKMIGVGSGVIFDAKHGLIVTNAHVVQDQKVMIVTLKDGRHFRAKLIGKDTGFDIAIIRIPAENLKAMPFGDSSNLNVGDFVATIGSPFGLTQTVTSGVISALNRSEPKIEGFQSFIQTDAPINPGNSGGALVSMHGELVGINTALISPGIDANIGIGFSIPSNMVRSVIFQLLSYGKVKRGMLGVIAQNITPELADAMHLKRSKGTMVSQVIPGSPAQAADIQARDIITSVNGKSIQSSAELRNTLGLMRPGTKIKLNIIRNHNATILTATVGDPLTFKPTHSNAFLAGMRLQNFSELEGDGTTLHGALVTDLTDTSAAALAGIMPGDIITTANSQPIKNTNTLVNIASKADKTLLLKISRVNRALFIVLQN